MLAVPVWRLSATRGRQQRTTTPSGHSLRLPSNVVHKCCSASTQQPVSETAKGALLGPSIAHRALYASLDRFLEVEAAISANPFYLSYESAFKSAGLKRATGRSAALATAAVSSSISREPLRAKKRCAAPRRGRAKQIGAGAQLHIAQPRAATNEQPWTTTLRWTRRS